jgi:hypothetical protein
MTFPRVASSFACAIAVAFALSAASPSGAAVRSSLTSDAGRQGDLVNRPGCGDEGSKPCEVVGGG